MKRGKALGYFKVESHFAQTIRDRFPTDLADGLEAESSRGWKMGKKAASRRLRGTRADGTVVPMFDESESAAKKAGIERKASPSRSLALELLDSHAARRSHGGGGMAPIPSE
ncbi:hypothetical protein KM043_000655 [Ampulex compressa]|nr:hypothetical protein KM043_000655 [Ampulex compressa]